MTRNEIIREMEKRLEEMKTTQDIEQFKALACSSIVASQDEVECRPIIGKDLCFKYRDHDFELTSCNSFISTEQVKEFVEKPWGAFSDRYVCWTYWFDDDDIMQWILVPNAWLWGASADLKPGKEVEQYLLDIIDEWLDN